MFSDAEILEEIMGIQPGEGVLLRFAILSGLSGCIHLPSDLSVSVVIDDISTYGVLLSKVPRLYIKRGDLGLIRITAYRAYLVIRRYEDSSYGTNLEYEDPQFVERVQLVLNQILTNGC